MKFKVKLRFKNGNEKQYETNSISDAKSFIRSHVGSGYTILDSSGLVVESGKTVAYKPVLEASRFQSEIAQSETARSEIEYSEISDFWFSSDPEISEFERFDCDRVLDWLRRPGSPCIDSENDFLRGWGLRLACYKILGRNAHAGRIALILWATQPFINREI